MKSLLATTLYRLIFFAFVVQLFVLNAHCQKQQGKKSCAGVSPSNGDGGWHQTDESESEVIQVRR